MSARPPPKVVNTPTMQLFSDLFHSICYVIPCYQWSWQYCFWFHVQHLQCYLHNYHSTLLLSVLLIKNNGFVGNSRHLVWCLMHGTTINALNLIEVQHCLLCRKRVNQKGIPGPHPKAVKEEKRVVVVWITGGSGFYVISFWEVKIIWINWLSDESRFD